MKSPVPDTRISLILRLPNGQDAAAWDEFVSIYQPLVYRLARSKGFQDTDAHEIVQEVLVAVSRAVERWVPDEQRGRFRDWLFQIARNLMINFLTRRKYRPIGNQDEPISSLLDQQCDPACAESAHFDLEYRRQVFQWAAGQVVNDVGHKTWQAFWRSSVDNRAIADVAAKLDITTGAVYVARSRVMARLRAAAQRFEAETLVKRSER